MIVMRVSARADYALRAAIQLAAAPDSRVTGEQLARAQNIPGKFIETILTHLRRVGIVRLQRGPDGGFWLARPASEISLADIIRAIDGQLPSARGEIPESLTYPARPSRCGASGSRCALSGRRSWRPSRSQTSYPASCGYPADLQSNPGVKAGTARPGARAMPHPSRSTFTLRSTRATSAGQRRAGLLQRVVEPLARRPVILRAAFCPSSPAPPALRPCPIWVGRQEPPAAQTSRARKPPLPKRPGPTSGC